MKTRSQADRRCPAARGAELVEFALILPLLLILVLGVLDFGAAFTARAKLTIAAREAARIVISSPLSDSSCTSTTPCAIIAAARAAVNSLNNAGMDASCITPASPTSNTALSWNYTCPNGTTLTINAGYTYPSPAGGLDQATQVTLSYPLRLKLAAFLPGFGKFTSMSTQVTMPNL